MLTAESFSVILAILIKPCPGSNNWEEESMSCSLHLEANAILARLKQEGITALYHFSSVENLPGICQMDALCSKQVLEEQGLLSTLTTGGNTLSHSLDRNRGNWDKVSLSFTPYTPMAYNRKKEQHLCFFLINPEVAAWSDVSFTDCNATKNDHRRGQGLVGLNNVQFNVIRAVPFSVDGWFQYVQAEVLIPVSIPLAYVTEVGFVSNASMNYSEYLCKSFSHPNFAVNTQLFTKSVREPAINFAYVKEFWLAGLEIEADVVYLKKKNEFSKSIDSFIKIVRQGYALTGTQEKALLRNLSSGAEKIVLEPTEFRRSGLYSPPIHPIHNIPLADLPTGSYLIKYFLDDICWSISSFEVVP